jgi:hypothetical protein
MKAKKRPAFFFKQLARIGCMATAVVYLIIGAVALMSLLKWRHGGADEASILRLLEDIPFGKIIISIILLGMVAYIVWRVYEALHDPYNYGRRLKGIVIRLITAFSAVSDALIAWPAVESLLGINTAMKNGEPTAQRQMFSELLQKDGGVWLVALIGIITSITAIVQFIYVVKKAYAERIDLKRLSAINARIIHVLSYSGHVARGTILSIIGFFMLKAAIAKNGQYVVNTDKAFDFLGDEVSHAVFAAIAIGTICYGFFMMAMGYFYDFKKGR